MVLSKLKGKILNFVSFFIFAERGFKFEIFWKRFSKDVYSVFFVSDPGHAFTEFSAAGVGILFDCIVDIIASNSAFVV